MPIAISESVVNDIGTHINKETFMMVKKMLWPLTEKLINTEGERRRKKYARIHTRIARKLWGSSWVAVWNWKRRKHLWTKNPIIPWRYSRCQYEKAAGQGRGLECLHWM